MKAENKGRREAVPKGIADLHNHQFGQLAFGGRVIWDGAYGDCATELRWCTDAHGLGGVGDVVGNVVKGTDGGGFIGHKPDGHPQFGGWSRWNSVTHQSVYKDWLRRAVDGSLRLMVTPAVSKEYVRGIVNKGPGRTCNDMEAVDLQPAGAAKDVEAYIDAKAGGAGLGTVRGELPVLHVDAADVVRAQRTLSVVLACTLGRRPRSPPEGDKRAATGHRVHRPGTDRGEPAGDVGRPTDRSLQGASR